LSIESRKEKKKRKEIQEKIVVSEENTKENARWSSR
jgi:hypothetical protein